MSHFSFPPHIQCPTCQTYSIDIRIKEGKCYVTPKRIRKWADLECPCGTTWQVLAYTTCAIEDCPWSG